MEELDTLQQVSLYKSQADKPSKAWHKQIEHWRKLYDMKHYASTPKDGEERYQDPTYTNTVDLTVGTILANDMDWRAFEWKPSASGQKDTSFVEKFLAGLIQINSERDEVLIPFEVLMNFARDGCGVLETIWDERLAQMYQDSFEIPTANPEDPNSEPVQVVPGFREPPLRVKVIDPTNIWVVPGGPGRWQHVMRIVSKSIWEIEMEFPMVSFPDYALYTQDQKATTYNELIDYWCYYEETRIVADPVTGMPKMGPDGNPLTNIVPVVKNALVYQNTVIWELREMKGYPSLPFTIGFFKPVDKDDAEKWGHGVMVPLESTISMLEKSINRRQRQITIFSALPVVANVSQGRNIQLDPSLGSLVKIDPSEKIGFPQWPGNPPDVEMQIGFLRARAQQSGFSDVMFGAGPSQVSGYGLSQLGDQNRIRLEQPVQHLQMFWERWAKLALKLTAHFAGDNVVRVYGRMKGMDFNEMIFARELSDYNIKCLIKPEFPNDKVRKHAMATQVRGILSDTTLMQEYLDIEQPDEELTRRIIDQAQNHPMVMQYGIIKQLKEMAKEGDEVAALVLQQMAQQGPPGQLPPQNQKQPPNPIQPTGLQSSTGQSTSQAQGQPPAGQGEGDMLSQLASLSPNMQGGV